MSDLIETLVALDACDRAIAELARERDEIPRAIARLEEQVRSGREALVAQRAALADVERKRRDKEHELQDCEVRRAKFQQQTALVKTNEEYTALLGEIEGVRVRIGAVEEAILLAMDEAETASELLAKQAEEQRGVEQDVERQIAERRARLALVESQIEARQADRSGLVPRVPRETRAIYERAHRALGSGTTRLRGRACASCHRDIPYETINRLQAGELHACPACCRILVGGSE